MTSYCIYISFIAFAFFLSVCSDCCFEAGIQTSGYLRTVSTGHGTCLGDAMAGAELLRLTGPGRGWYPRHRQPRPASVEHLDRLTPQGLSPNAPTGGTWEGREAGKPLTLPPNLSPKFFQRSPREALRRVTSLLIRKGELHKNYFGHGCY